jgi:uncharacterized membrane protein YadS
VAPAVGLIGGNLLPVPKWLVSSFRTEYYVKTGIILLGATLPFTLIYRAGPVAFLQATIVSVTTFMTIYLVGTRVLKLDRRFSSTMGAGGSVCGVSASIAVGGGVPAMEIWWRFPKFVLGFFVASVIILLVSMGYSDEAFDKLLKPLLIGPIKTLRIWTFIFTFLSIGFTTRFRDLAKFGRHPLAAFAASVAINVPLGYFLSTIVFADYWRKIPG